jgi:hypothetical protein
MCFNLCYTTIAITREVFLGRQDQILSLVNNIRRLMSVAKGISVGWEFHPAQVMGVISLSRIIIS